jgi:SagB-type dehydrogenase family enzyme
MSSLGTFIAVVGACGFGHSGGTGTGQQARTIQLPDPDRDGPVSVEAAMQQRRSVREFAPSALTLADVSQLLWAAQGITSPDGGRTAPSAGATYPIELYVVIGDVEGVQPGVFRYLPDRHALVETATDDRRSVLAGAALRQDALQSAPLVVVIAAVYHRTAQRYGARAPRYVHIEVGNVAQNVYLQAAARGLGTVFIGAFDDAEVKQVLDLRPAEEPLGLMPVGRVQ